MKGPDFRPLRVTILSGISGAGKSSFLRKLVTKRIKSRSVVIVNSQNQTPSVADVFGQPTHWPREFVAIAGGCICCDQREEWTAEMRRLAEVSSADSIFVEATGVAEPSPLAEPFFDDRWLGSVPRLRLHRLVTVLDAETFLDDFESTDDLRDRGLAM